LGYLYVKKYATITREKWDKLMMDTLGEGAQTHLDAIWNRAHLVEVDPDESPISGNAAKQIYVQFVQGGMDRDRAVNATHEVLKESEPNLTRTEAVDAICLYGRWVPATTDALKVKVAGYTSELIQQRKLQDMAEGKAPSPTGRGRPRPTDEYRRLTHLVNEAKKKGGYEVVDAERQLRSYLDTERTRLENQITDLTARIKDRDLFPEKVPRPPTPELDGLRAQRDALRAELKALQEAERPGPTPEEKAFQARTRQLEKQIAEYEQRIADRNLFPSKTAAPAADPRLAPLIAKREAAKAALKALQDEARPPLTPDEKKVNTRIKQLERQIEHFQERLASKDYTVSPKPLPANQPTGTLLDRLRTRDRLKSQFEHESFLLRMKNRPPADKILGVIREIGVFPRAVRASFDLSAVLRQGKFILMAHPIRAFKNFGWMLRALASEDAQYASEQEIKSRTLYLIYRSSGLYLAESGDSLTKMEEAYTSRWAEKIPGIKQSQRAYTTFLNRLRADSFDAMMLGLSQDGVPTPAEAKAVANFINMATGRGGFGSNENVATGLNTVFFAPRYVASRFQLLMGQPLWRGSRRTRKMIGLEYLRFLSAMAVMYALASLAGFRIEWDPKSSNFAKIQVSETGFIDPLAGLQQAIVFAWRMWTGETTDISGETYDLRGPDERYGRGIVSVAEKFFSSKLSPVPSVFWTELKKKTYENEPPTWPSAAEDFPGITLGSRVGGLITPIASENVYEVLKNEEVKAAIPMAILAIFGEGAQSFEE
ncbi:MAG: hypothetical protein IMZ54_09980, partial [Acidobacteria bacterium]|nr:hypothetical protein [Acidobacteriota bacterium]